MPKLVPVRRLPHALIAAVVLAAVAAPASAKVVYRWKTDDGVYAFTDDAKRIPQKYRAEAKASSLRPLHAYKKFTPAQRSGTSAYAKRMERSAEEMAKLNARVSGRSPALRSGAPEDWPSDEAVLRVGTAGQSQVEVQAGGLGSGEPIVIEQKRFYVPGLNSTRQDTIVRQGGRILAVTKPLPHQQDISDIENESSLPQ